jgi:membrane protein
LERAQAPATVDEPYPQSEPTVAAWWWQVLLRVVDRLQLHNAPLLAGGIAMYGLLSVFPGLAAAVSVYGLFATPADVIDHMKLFSGILPPGVWVIFNAQLQSVVAQDHGSLTVAAALSLLIALWSARLTMSALMTTTTIAYDVPDKRSYLLQLLVSLLLTIGVILGFLVMLLLGIVVPLVLTMLGTSALQQLSATLLRWLLLWLFAIAGLDVVYFFAPATAHKRWHWITPGAALAASCWLVVSVGFAIYVRTIAGYDRTYGALAGVIVLLVWFYLLSLIVIVGAEVNAAIEHQLRRHARLARAAE